MILFVDSNFDRDAFDLSLFLSQVQTLFIFVKPVEVSSGSSKILKYHISTGISPNAEQCIRLSYREKFLSINKQCDANEVLPLISSLIHNSSLLKTERQRQMLKNFRIRYLEKVDECVYDSLNDSSKSCTFIFCILKTQNF